MEERRAWAASGFVGLVAVIVLAAVGVALVVLGIPGLEAARTSSIVLFVVGLFAVLVVVPLAASGLVVVQPNQARAIVFFGRFAGVIRRAGFWYALPLSSKPRVSLRVRNFETARLKVNDVRGNPIEIAAVVVWRVVDVAKALFEVNAYEAFVTTQSETALRHIASLYPYDVFGEERRSLRGNTDEVSRDLQRELQARVAVAGVEMLEARLTHLAYSSEIAGAMLQRQQAEAVVAARAKIVEGAVGMVQMAIRALKDSGVADLDAERTAAMINNLMVAVVSERAAQPVINTGSLY